MPRVLVLAAPAGYGKTAIARAYAGVHKSYAAIDLSHARTSRVLLLALLEVLAAPRGADRVYLRQAQLSLAADETLPLRLVERILDMWREPAPPAAVTFENAECLPPSVLPLLNEILRRRPGQRACIVCSNTALDLDAPPVPVPAEMMLLNSSDLRLSESQVEALFSKSGISAAELRFVTDAAGGWPLMAALLRYLHVRGRLQAVMHDSRIAAGAEHAYDLVQERVLETLSTQVRRALEFCAVVPRPQMEDVQACLGRQTAQALRACAQSFPLLRIDDEGVEVHELLRGALAGRNPSAIEDIRLAARAAARRGERGIAAERYVACDDRVAAGNLLDDVLERGATASVAMPATLLEPQILNQHPRWVALTALLRRFDVAPAEALAGIQARRAHQHGGDPMGRLAFNAFETHQLLHCGLQKQAAERLEDVEAVVAELKKGGIGNALRAHVAGRFADTLKAALAIARGDFERGERLLKRGRFPFGEFPLMTVSAAVDGWLSIGLVRGDFPMIHEQCTRARETLARAGLDMALLDVDANEALAAWALDDERYRELIERVDERARVYHHRAYDHLLGCAGMRPECYPTGLEPLRRLIIAHLVGAGRRNDDKGLHHAYAALLAARELHQPLFVTIAAIAVRERGGDPACRPGETLALAPGVELAILERMRRPVTSY